MREQICRNCGYRQLEKEMFDYIAQVPVYPNFMVNNVLPYMNASQYTGNSNRCPECGMKYQ